MDNLVTLADLTRYTTIEAFMRAQHEVFFGEALDGSINSADWRVALTQRLREHLTLVNLLRVMEGRWSGRRPDWARQARSGRGQLGRRAAVAPPTVTPGMEPFRTQCRQWLRFHVLMPCRHATTVAPEGNGWPGTRWASSQIAVI